MVNYINLKKKKSVLLGYLLFNVFFITTIIIEEFVFSVSFSLTPLIPISGFLIEILVIIVIILPLLSIISIFLGAYIFAPLFLKILKLINGKKRSYAIQVKLDAQKIRTSSLQVLFPGLMTVSLGLFFTNPTIYNLILGSDIINIPVMASIGSFIVGFLFTFPISLILFSSVWVLSNTGIIFTYNKELEARNYPREVKSAGGFIRTILKGYTGIGAIYAYIQFLFGYFEGIGTLGDPVILLINLMTFPIFPLFLALISVPGMVIFDLRYNNIKNYMEKIARKMSIVDKVDISLTKVQ